MSIWILEKFCEVTKSEDAEGNYDEKSSMYYAGEPMDTGLHSIGELFRSLAGQYGRCVSKVYTEKGGQESPIGWVFESRQPYDRGGGTFLRHAWIEVLKGPDLVTRQFTTLKEIARC